MLPIVRSRETSTSPSFDPPISHYRERADKPDDPAASDCVVKQGIFLGRLDNLMESLITTEGEHRRLITFGRFEERLFSGTLRC